ncbi:hypothetical protein EDB81DRAFT_879566 [Dactylonectria macrodidyma]|uniref:Uncharacterized protein n=1 Tax=Dactylonectria macrodidyma TaxID=307937 RepID=A0A9P9FE81_9HYPO|nr:hypothetical protein EDB81DRAFT_879566 [Dactylonectria macrodidyma]
MESDEAQCQALQLSDAQRCKKEATSANGLFCHFHSRQAFGLYRGYKRRNARLDALEGEAPVALKESPIPLANQTFESIDDQKTLQEILSHLFEQYVLLGKVIDARKLHHKHFYSLNMDYGHQVYLDKLISQRHTVLLALGRVEKRTAYVLYQNEQWFKWVREIQAQREAAGEKEQKKVKQEAALFKRNWKQLQAQLKLKREKEDQKRQDAFLEEAYQERMKSISAEEAEGDEAWDPIEDMTQDDRDRYIDLIKHFLWIDIPDVEKAPARATGSKGKGKEPAVEDGPCPTPKKAKKRSKAKSGVAKEAQAPKADGGPSAPQPVPAPTSQQRLLALQASNQAGAAPALQEPDKSNIETEDEMRKRLSEGVEKKPGDYSGFQIIGTIDMPAETHTKTAPMTKEEIVSVIKDIREIKLFLFCRVLLANASLLPAALRASSVQDFLSDAQIAESDLRDLCLKVERPSLQEIRDACADFIRGDRADDDNEDDSESSEEFDETLQNVHNSHLVDGEEIAKRQRALMPPKRSSSKVAVCGKTIWNHASDKAMSRDGWLQFSIMAKDCNIKHAIQLCRNWTEFSDLHTLAHWQYFPVSNWQSWHGNRLTQELQDMGLFTYFIDFEASKNFERNKKQRLRRPKPKRPGDIISQSRNVMAANMKRDDPVTRRFLQYLMMRAGEVLVVVRDGKTGRIITAPPKDNLWTCRQKTGVEGAEWQHVLSVGPEFFNMTDRLREWRFGFPGYYDIYIWDLRVDQPSIDMVERIVTELRFAWRMVHPTDKYLQSKTLLQSLTRELSTMRTRQIREGEKVMSLWDMLMGERTEHKSAVIKDGTVLLNLDFDKIKSTYMFYNEANAVEDAILFSDEFSVTKGKVPFREITNGVRRIERSALPGFQHAHNCDWMDTAITPRDISDASQNITWALPNVWKTGLKQFINGPLGIEEYWLLGQAGLAKMPTASRVQTFELEEQQRACEFKTSFHEADLEPEGRQRFLDIQDRINTMLSLSHSGPADWIYFIVRIIVGLGLTATPDRPFHHHCGAWPNSFVIQDMTQAFAQMAMFFPKLGVTAQVTEFLQSSQCEVFRNSLLFKPQERSQTIPDRRTSTSRMYRKERFWAEWKKVLAKPGCFSDRYPMDWSLALRPIVAQLYRAGVIAPAYFPRNTELMVGRATANTEPHRPGKKDLFINYDDPRKLYPFDFPLELTPYDKWPDLLFHARAYKGEFPTARFGLLRVWSPPHFYPIIIPTEYRRGLSFTDSAGRSWEWRFVPKDMNGSEFAAQQATKGCLSPWADHFAENVVTRGDLILVMGVDSLDLLGFCVAVTWAIQTKPWLREIDLWKSFINVDFEFLLDLPSYWLD